MFNSLDCIFTILVWANKPSINSSGHRKIFHRRIKMQTRFILLLLQAPLVLRGYEINSEIEHARTRDSANTAAKPSYESGNGGRGSRWIWQGRICFRAWPLCKGRGQSCKDWRSLLASMEPLQHVLGNFFLKVTAPPCKNPESWGWSLFCSAVMRAEPFRPPRAFCVTCPLARARPVDRINKNSRIKAKLSSDLLRDKTSHARQHSYASPAWQLLKASILFGCTSTATKFADSSSQIWKTFLEKKNNSE